jgi:acetyl esterase/lipase
MRFAVALFLFAGVSFGSDQVVLLWPGVAPGSESWTQKEIEYKNQRGETMVRNIVQPSITVFLPDRASANGTGIVVAPGGGFRFLSWDSEGTDVAKWLNARGVAAFVLKYRVAETPADPDEFQKQMSAMFGRGRTAGGGGARTDTAPADPGRAKGQDTRALAVADGKQALKVVRSHASEWGIAPEKSGLMGFSAGAMLTTGVLTDYDAETRPSFAASIYGNSVEQSRVPADAPPLFILCAEDDPLLPATGSANLFAAWKNSGHIAELHIYSKGGHGFGMHQQGLPVDHWIERFGDWLAAQGLLKGSH